MRNLHTNTPNDAIERPMMEFFTSNRILCLTWYSGKVKSLWDDLSCVGRASLVRTDKLEIFGWAFGKSDDDDCDCEFVIKKS